MAWRIVKSEWGLGTPSKADLAKMGWFERFIARTVGVSMRFNTWVDDESGLSFVLPDGEKPEDILETLAA